MELLLSKKKEERTEITDGGGPGSAKSNLMLERKDRRFG